MRWICLSAECLMASISNASMSSVSTLLRSVRYLNKVRYCPAADLSFLAFYFMPLYMVDRFSVFLVSTYEALAGTLFRYDGLVNGFIGYHFSLKVGQLSDSISRAYR